MTHDLTIEADRTRGPSPRQTPPRIGVVLSGGGARGFAHAGFLRALNHLGIYPDIIVGVSMGAVVGGTYALNHAWYDDLIDMDTSGFPLLPDFSEEGTINYLKNLRLSQKVITGMYFGWGAGQPTVEWGRALLRRLTLGKTLEEARIPIFAGATDMESGERVVIGSGSAEDAIYASSALAGILPPASRDGRLLIDGGYSDLAPIDVARNAGADIVIVSDAATSFRSSLPVNGIQAMYRAIEICQNEHTRLRAAQADLVIRPQFDTPVGVLDFKRKRHCAAAGARATFRMRRNLLELMSRGAATANR